MRLFHCTVVCGGGSPEALTFSSTGPCTWLLFSALRTVRFDIVLPLQVHNNGSCPPSIPIFRLVLQNFAIPGYFPYILFYSYIFSLLSWVGGGGFSKVVVTFSHVGGSFNLLWALPGLSNLGLCAACWAHFICHHELWPTSPSHPFSFLNSSLGLAGGKHYQKMTIPSVSLDLFFKILLFQVTFLIFFFIAIFPPYFLLVGSLLQYVALFQSKELVKY